MNPFKWTTQTSKADLLDAGTHKVRITRVNQTNDRCKDLAGTPKTEGLPPWSDPTNQVAVVFANSDGVIMRRYSTMSYIKMDKVEEHLEELKAMGINPEDLEGYSSAFGNENYACIKNAEGQLVRVASPKLTEKALGFLHDLTTALGVEDDQDGMLALENAVASKTEIEIVVETKVFNKKKSSIVSKTRKASQTVNSDSESF